MTPDMLLIGAVLSSPAVAYHEALEHGVSAESFHDSRAALLWAKCEEIIRKTNSVDRYALLTALPPDYHALVDDIPHDVPADTASVHATAIRSAEKQRKLERVIKQYKDVMGDIDGHITALATDVMGILHGSQVHKVRHIGEIAPDVEAEIRAIADGKHEAVVGYSSSIPQVNDWAVPYPKGKTAVIAGYQGLGKSTYAKQEIFHLARQGVKVGLISMEDTARDIVTNMATIDGAGFMWKFQRGAGDVRRFSNSIARMKDLPIWICDQPQSIGEWEATATLMTAKYGVQVVFTDHLHEISGDRGHRYHSIDERYTDYMERITGTIKRLDIAHVLFAQFSRDSEKEQRRPKMSDLKGSSAIEQKARRIYLLFMEDHRLWLEGAKISNSGWGSKDQRKVELAYARDHDGFEVV